MSVTPLTLRLLIACLLLLAGGCASEPFEREPLPDLGAVDPAALIGDFASRVPEKFTSEDSVLIETSYRGLSLLGYLRVDRTTGHFELLGMNPAGVQMFLLSGNADHTEIKSSVGPLKDRPQLLYGLADDIRRIYFGLTPPGEARTSIRAKQLRATSDVNGTTLRYEFGGAPAVLLEKSQRNWFGYDWRVRYFNYETRGGKSMPRGIVMDNKRLHYRIVIRNRGW